MNNAISTLSKNQNPIGDNIKRLIAAFNETSFSYIHYREIHEILNQIKLNFDSLLIILTNIENAVGFAGLKMFHRSIVFPNDLRKIIYEFYKTHNGAQMLFFGEE